LPEAAHEHCHVGALPAPIRVQLIEHEKLEAATVLHNAAIDRLKARED